MEVLKIEAKKRSGTGLAFNRRLRDEGYLPCVIYGRGKDNIPVSVAQAEIVKYIRQSAKVVEIEVDKKCEQTIVKEIQYDPMGDTIIHLDFLRISMDEEITMLVPIEIKGIAKGVADGGIVETLRAELQVRCLPTNIPETIPVDITDLGIDEALHLKDLTLPEGVALEDNLELTVVAVVSKIEVAEPEPAEGEEGAEEGEAEGEEASAQDEEKPEE